MNFFETFSPVTRLNSIKILLSYCCQSVVVIVQLNVKNAFLYGDLKEEVYIEHTLGYVAEGENKVSRLRKVIYEFKESPRAWFEKFSIIISGIDFHRYHSDHYAFVQLTKSGLVILTVYIDILLTESDSAGLVETKEYLRRHFVTKNMGKPKYFPGIEMAQKHGILLLKEVCSGSSRGKWTFWVQIC